jgi:WhiB family redox-sensing transcriptional regulator
LRRRIDPDWQDLGACADTDDPDAWFPAPTATAEEIAVPLAICLACPVRRSCLAAGLLGREYGIWGGTTEDERRALLRASRKVTV